MCHCNEGLLVCLLTAFILRLPHPHLFILHPTSMEKLISVLVLSRLDYCSALLTDVPQSFLGRLRKVQNAAARFTVKASRHITPIFHSRHITPIFHSLQWQPGAGRIQYKVSPLCHSSSSDSSPKDLSMVLQIYTALRQLLFSSDNHILCVPYRHQNKNLQSNILFICWSLIWNKLPYEIKVDT